MLGAVAFAFAVLAVRRRSLLVTLAAGLGGYAVVAWLT